MHILWTIFYFAILLSPWIAITILCGRIEKLEDLERVRRANGEVGEE